MSHRTEPPLHHNIARHRWWMNRRPNGVRRLRPELLDDRIVPAISVFQQGVDFGFGAYAGTVDTQLYQGNPDFNYGGDPDALLVDDDPTIAGQALVRFNNIIGAGLGQIPANAVILNAYLTLNTVNDGDGGSMPRMLIDWADSVTWNSAGSNSGGYNATAGIQADNVEAKNTFASQAGVTALNQDLVSGRCDIKVTPDIQAWANGEANYGWAFLPFVGGTNGWEFDTAENAVPANRPKLTVEWVTAAELATTYKTVSFQENVGGYLGTQDVQLNQATPGTVSNGTTSSVDFNNLTTDIQSLLRFDNIIGAGGTQIPFGAKIQRALLTVNITDSGDGAQLFRMFNTWSEASTWNSMVGGVSPDGVEAHATFFGRAGSPLLTPNYGVWTNSIDVTPDVQAWADGESNFGWALVPWLSGTDVMTWSSSEATNSALRPRLTVWFEPTASPIQAVDNTLDVTSDKLTYLGGTGVSNAVAINHAAGNYTITDTSPITLSANALLAGWTLSDPMTAVGPDTSVTTLIVNTLNGDDTITVNGAADSLMLRGGGNSADDLVIANSLALSGLTFDATGFANISAGPGVKITAATVNLAGNAIGSAVTPIATAADTISGFSGAGGVFITEDDGATVPSLRAGASGEIRFSNLSGLLNIPNDIGGFMGAIDIASDDGLNLNGFIASLFTATVNVRVNTDGAGNEGFVMGFYGGIGTGNTSPILVEVNTASGGTGPAVIGQIITSVSNSSIQVNANGGAITYAKNGTSAIATGTTGAIDLRGTGVGSVGARLPIAALNVTVISGTGGVFLEESGANPTVYTITNIDGDVEIISLDASNNGITIAAPLTSVTGDITLRADDSLLINAQIGGFGFSGRVFLESNRDGLNEQVISIAAGAPIITTNNSAQAIQMIVHATTTSAGIGGIVLSDDVIAGNGGVISMDAAGLLGNSTDTNRAGTIVLGFGAVGGTGTGVEISAGALGAVNLIAKDNPIGLPGIPLFINAGTVMAVTNSTTSTTNSGQPAADVEVIGDLIVNLAAQTTTAGTRVGNISVATMAGPLNLVGDVKVDSGTISLSTTSGILQTAGVVSTTGGLNLTYVGTATFNSTGNAAPTLNVAAGNTVIVDGSFTPTTAVGVDGILKGKGSVGAVTVNATGEVAPGTSPGILSTGDVVMTAGSKFTVELNGAAVGTGYDQLNVTGTVDLGGATLNASLGFVPPSGSKYIIVNNDGSDTVTNTFNGLAEGANVVIGSTTFTISYQGGDGNDVVLTAPGVAAPPPTITGPITINGGTQRSMVQSLTITFSEAVTLQPGAFKVEGTALGPIGDVGLTVQQLGNVVTLTFNNSGVAIDPAGSLADGKYKLTVVADKITGTGGGTLDGNSNGNSQGSPTDDVTLDFHRLFGDGNGDGIVNATDFNAFRLAYGSVGPSIYDFDGLGGVNASDFNAFRLRYGSSGYLP